jgi:hypothetical protein
MRSLIASLMDSVDMQYWKGVHALMLAYSVWDDTGENVEGISYQVC